MTFENNSITIKWLTAEEELIETQVEIGDSLLEAAHKNEIDLEGACESR